MRRFGVAAVLAALCLATGATQLNATRVHKRDGLTTSKRLQPRQPIRLRILGRSRRHAPLAARRRHNKVAMAVVYTKMPLEHTG